MVVFGELGTGQTNLVTMRTRNQQERDVWRTHRKLAHLGVGVQAVRKYRDLQNNESKVLAYEILETPQDFEKHMERYATSVVSIIAFGRRVKSFLDPIITEVIAVMQLAAELNVPGKSFPMLMETFPILAKVPPRLRKYCPWMKGLGQRGQKGGHYFFYALAKEAYDKPETHEDSYVKTLFREQPKYNLTTEEISSLTGNLFGAGSDTSSSTLITFILACCAFPEVLVPAWEEIDRVVGPHRSPHFDDQANLPYINAFVKETLRWRSVAIIGGQPHSPTQDDYYNGFLIPRDSWVQGNIWAIHHHEREFPDPDRFMPERFFDGNPYKRPFPGERGYMTFGWGRRVCSGQALAEQGTWITVARLLWAFRIQKARDERGEEIPVDIFNFT
jgi:cytochrome P450